MFENGHHEMPSTRRMDVFAGVRRPLSPVPSPSSPKRVKMENSCEISGPVAEGNEIDGWGHNIWQSQGTNNTFTSRSLSQTLHHALEDEDVKYDPAHLDAQYQDQQIQEAMKIVPHTSEESTHPLRLKSPCQPPDSRSGSPGSPTRYASSSPFRKRRPRPPPRLCKRQKRPTAPPPAPPPAPQMELLTSPPGATPPPLLFSSPRASQIVDLERAVHQQDPRNTLVLGENELAYLNNIVPSPSDDVFATVPSRKNSLSRLIRKKHDNGSTSMPVNNPASDPISEWTVVARKEHEELIEYPCDDFKFRTEKHDVLGSWDEMGNIKDIDGNVRR
ncbi:hypothetical protein KCU71_g10698, partial [Aureobasidium melanogenum]